MSSYPEPDHIPLPTIFNPEDFTNLEDYLTYIRANKLYLRLPTGAPAVGKLPVSLGGTQTGWSYPNNLNQAEFYLSPFYVNDPATRRFNNLFDCVAYIATIPYVGYYRSILVGSGTYFETQPIVMPPWVEIICSRGQTATFYLVGYIVGTWIKYSTNCFILGGTFYANGLADNMFELTGAYSADAFIQCVFAGARNAIFLISDYYINLICDGTSITAFDFTPFGGLPNQTGKGIVNTGYIGSIVYFVDGIISSHLFIAPPFIWGAPFIGVELSGFGTQFLCYNSRIDNLTTCFSGSGITIESIGNYFENSTTAYSLNNACVVDIISSVFNNNITDINIIDNNTKLNFINGTLDTDKIIYPPNPSSTNINFNFVDTNLDNGIGTHIISDFYVGTEELATNSFFGNGGKQTSHVYVFKFNPVGAVFTNVSALSRPSVATPITMFDSLLAGNILYIIHQENAKFGGLVVNISQTLIETTALTDVVAQYWNGATWITTTIMNTIDVSPYTSYGKQLFAITGNLETRFNVVISLGNTWVQNTINGITGFAMRFIILNPIVRSPIFNSLSIFLNSTRIDSAGVLVAYGTARSRQQMFYNVNLALPTSGGAPATQDLYLSDLISFGQQYNRFVVNDAIGSTLLLNADIDTSCPLTMVLGYISNSQVINQTPFTIEIRHYPLTNNTNILYLTLATSPADIVGTLLSTISLPLNATNGQIVQYIEIDLDVSKYIVRSNQVINQMLSFSLKRIASANANSLVLSSLTFLYYRVSSGSVRV